MNKTCFAGLRRTEYDYVVIGEQRVLVEPGTRKTIQVVG
jgi:hypothetical protein